MDRVIGMDVKTLVTCITVAVTPLHISPVAKPCYYVQELKLQYTGKRGHILIGGTSLNQGLLGQKYMTNPINQYTSANPTIINGFTIFARTCNNLRFPIFLLSSFP